MLLAVLPGRAMAQPVSNAFTYQGELRDGGAVADGIYDLRFRLYDALAGGAQVGPTLCVDNVPVADGKFSVELDFGGIFGGTSRYMEIDVRADTGLTCGSSTGFTTLSPRQKITSTPYASYALSAASAQNATTFNGQLPSFYTNAMNLTGTLADARLSTNVSLLSGAQAFSGVKTFSASPVFASAGAPFAVSSTTKVTGLNADLLDGIDSGGFAAAAHGHDASAIVSGLLGDARIPSSVPRVGLSNVFSDTQVVSVSAQTPLTLVGSNTGGTWVNLQNTGGGRTWNMIATGSGNSEGAGKLLLRDQTGGAVRMTVDSAGRVGLGTTSPSAPLEVSQADASIRVRNTNDPGGGFLLNTFSTLQLGIYNPTASAWGAVPAGVQRSMFGVQNTGRVGTMTNTSGSPVWRNTIDDGAGNASFQGNIAANNMPAMKFIETGAGSTPSISNDSVTLIDEIVVNVSATGFLHITCRAPTFLSIPPNNLGQLYLELKETTGAEVLIKESFYSYYGVLSPGNTSIQQALTLEHTIPVTAGTRKFKVRLRHAATGSGSGSGFARITVMYFPSGGL